MAKNDARVTDNPKLKQKTLSDGNFSLYLDYYLGRANVRNEETGEIVECLRTVLIDKSGKTYVAVSQGITSALSKVFSIVGMPDGGAWHKDPVKMKIKQVKTRNGMNKVNTIELV